MTAWRVNFTYLSETGQFLTYERVVDCVPRVGDQVDFLSTDEGPADLFVVKNVTWRYSD